MACIPHGTLGDFPRTLRIMPCPLFSVTPRPLFSVTPRPPSKGLRVSVLHPPTSLICTPVQATPILLWLPLSAHCRAFAGISLAWHSPGFLSGCHLLMLSPPSLSLCFIFPQHLPQHKRTVTVYLFSVFLSKHERNCVYPGLTHPITPEPVWCLAGTTAQSQRFWKHSFLTFGLSNLGSLPLLWVIKSWFWRFGDLSILLLSWKKNIRKESRGIFSRNRSTSTQPSGS